MVWRVGMADNGVVLDGCGMAGISCSEMVEQ